MFITLNIACHKEPEEGELTVKQKEELNLPVDDHEESEWRVAKVNINHISTYYPHGNKVDTLIHCGGQVLQVKETTEEIDNLIKQLTNGNTYGYTATIS